MITVKLSKESRESGAKAPPQSYKELEDIRTKIGVDRKEKLSRGVKTVAVCAGTGCLALGAEKVVAKLREEIKEQRLGDKLKIRETGCLGFCEQGPRIIVYPEEICYCKVEPEDIAEIVSATARNEIVERLLYTDPVTGQTCHDLSEIPFYRHQLRILLETNAKINPKKIEDYIAEGGYSALTKAFFEMTREEVLEEVKRSGLRGRGGGGFPTGRKWEATRDAAQDAQDVQDVQDAPGEKYVIVNCDEGDPGAFMDRSLMEGNPHSVLEGLIIGAYAIGARKGYIYIRQEYPLALENTRIALRQAEEYGLIGEDILGSGFSFNTEIHRGAGAFVSGESSALTSAIEGKLGQPKPKYIHTSEKGVWGKPTNLNNVETWANIPHIVNKGAEWFNHIGTETSKGTKIFSLVGKVNNTGLVEVPMGITIKEMVYRIGGGILKDGELKAVQIGGPSGGFIPKSLIDTRIDFDELTKLGGMMGSGGLIVMDEDTCMVDVARYYINFLSEESCGQCIPCREGLRQTLKILNRICEGKGLEEDTDLLRELSDLLRDGSLCALGKTAANPVLTSLQYFPEEYEAHIKERRCPAGVCTELISYIIDPEKCTECKLCAKNCPVDAIPEETYIIDQEKCVKCGTCLDLCKFDAVLKIPKNSLPR